MTVDDHLLIDLSDIRAIQFRCRGCGTTVGHPPEKWSPSGFICPNCNRQWLGGQTIALKAITELAGALKTLLGPESKEFQFDVRLQIEHPKG